jgi:hypothetical protein
MQHPVTLYADKQFSGPLISLNYGNYIDLAATTGFSNNEASSIRIAPFTTVYLYDDSNFTGRVLALSGPLDIASLDAYPGGMNNKTVSIKVIERNPSLQERLDCCNGKTSAAVCGKYQPGTSAGCQATMLEHCSLGDNMSDPKCKTWCRTNTDVCDAPVIRYCDRYPSDPYCSCIKSPAQSGNVINPKCIDAKCISDGYLTTNMLATPCPSVVDCRITANLLNSGMQLASGTVINQNCGDKSTQDQVAAASAEADRSNSTFIIIIILIVFIAITMAAATAIFVIRGGDDDVIDIEFPSDQLIIH